MCCYNSFSTCCDTKCCSPNTTCINDTCCPLNSKVRPNGKCKVVKHPPSSALQHRHINADSTITRHISQREILFPGPHLRQAPPQQVSTATIPSAAIPVIISAPSAVTIRVVLMIASTAVGSLLSEECDLCGEWDSV